MIRITTAVRRTIAQSALLVAGAMLRIGRALERMGARIASGRLPRDREYYARKATKEEAERKLAEARKKIGKPQK